MAQSAVVSTSWWVRFLGTHILCNLDTLSDVLSNNRTSVVPPAVSTVRELDAPAAICDALIWCASASASEALLAASTLGAPSSLLTPHPLIDPYASWHSLEGKVGEFLK